MTVAGITPELVELATLTPGADSPGENLAAQSIRSGVIEMQSTSAGRLIPVAISARHVHLTRKTIERLFGDGHVLHPRGALSQPGQFAALETVSLIGPQGRLDRVRVLGPPRDVDQVEISRTDERSLGIDAPVRLSGDLAATPGVILEGPNGRAELGAGVVCALRHIHMSPADAEAFGVADRDVVQVAIESPVRPVVFGDVVVRVSPHFRLELHLDTDEGNAAGVGPDTLARLVGASSFADGLRR